jgi:hypothetical protein
MMLLGRPCKQPLRGASDKEAEFVGLFQTLYDEAAAACQVDALNCSIEQWNIEVAGAMPLFCGSKSKC